MRRALNPRPIFGSSIAGQLPATLPVPVDVGHEYELFTDAEVVDEASGAVTYPMCFVTDGPGGEQEGTAASMVPFHKMRSVVVVATASSLHIAVTVECSVWICQVARPQMRLPVPGGAGCGCKACKVDDDDDDDNQKKKKPCGCSAARW